MIIGRRFDYEEWIVFETIPEDKFHLSAYVPCEIPRDYP